MGGAYALARWLMNTVAPLVSARIALACIWVLGGNTPFARRVMMDLGRVRSYITVLLVLHRIWQIMVVSRNVHTSMVRLSLSFSLFLSFSLSFLSEGCDCAAGVEPDTEGSAASGAGVSVVMALSSSSASTNRATETSLRRPSLLRVGIVAPVALGPGASFRFVWWYRRSLFANHTIYIARWSP